MVHLNRGRLSTTQLRSLFEQLSRALKMRSEEQTESIVSELLGTEERIMIAKRLAMIVLLREGASFYRTASVLKVSSATAKKTKTKLECGEYDKIIALLGKNKKAYVAILDTLDSILHLGGILPHRVGLDRYRFLK